MSDGIIIVLQRIGEFQYIDTIQNASYIGSMSDGIIIVLQRIGEFQHIDTIQSASYKVTFVPKKSNRVRLES